MSKMMAVAVSVLALTAGSAAWASGVDGVVPAQNQAMMQKYYVTSCADYLAHPEAERQAVIAWMSHFTPQDANRGAGQNFALDADRSGDPQVGEVDAACATEPNQLVVNLLDDHRDARID